MYTYTHTYAHRQTDKTKYQIRNSRQIPNKKLTSSSVQGKQVVCLWGVCALGVLTLVMWCNIQPSSPTPVLSLFPPPFFPESGITSPLPYVLATEKIRNERRVVDLTRTVCHLRVIYKLVYLLTHWQGKSRSLCHGRFLQWLTWTYCLGVSGDRTSGSRTSGSSPLDLPRLRSQKASGPVLCPRVWGSSGVGDWFGTVRRKPLNRKEHRTLCDRVHPGLTPESFMFG